MLIFVFFFSQGLDSYILRFMAKVITKNPIQAERRFVISYYLADDTVNIHEPPMRNSGNKTKILTNICLVFFRLNRY
jgi:hypothetical protein